MRAVVTIAIAAAAMMAASNTDAREACQERTLGVRYSPQVVGNWCWAASSQVAPAAYHFCLPTVSRLSARPTRSSE